MCLIIGGSYIPTILTDDIVAYKAFKENPSKFLGTTIGVKSLFYKKLYRFNKTYETEIVRERFNYEYFDEIEQIRVHRTLTPSYHLNAISKGFHFATNIQRLINGLNNDLSYSIYKVIIPKGSTVFKGIDDELMASNKIIVIKEKVK